MRVDVLAARGRQAFVEYQPITVQPDDAGRVYRRIAYGPLLDVFVVDMRPHEGPNSPGRQPGSAPDAALLGQQQLDWLLHALRTSRATWKVVAADLPIGLVVADGPTDLEAAAQGDPGAPLGRELEIAQVLSGIRRAGVRNVVWLTADVHYTAAHHHSPERASFPDFSPFWEFVSGLLNAGTFPALPLDATFGPRAVFVAAPPHADASPASGHQYFGEVVIAGDAGTFSVRLRDASGAVLHTQVLTAEG